MKLLVRAVAFLALAALGVWLWLVLFPSPETVVRHHLEKLARRASFSADEGELVPQADRVVSPAAKPTGTPHKAVKPPVLQQE